MNQKGKLGDGRFPDSEPPPMTDPEKKGHAGGRRFEADNLVDEKASTIDIAEDKTPKLAEEAEATVGATGPANWWRVGILVLVILTALVLILQWITGGSVAPSGPPPQ